MNCHSRKRVHSQAFSLAPGHIDYVDCNPSAGRYPPFYPPFDSTAPRPASAYYLNQENMERFGQDENGCFITPNAPVSGYTAGRYPQHYPQHYNQAPNVYPSQFNATLAAYARQQYEQYGNAPETLLKTFPNLIQSSAYGLPGIPNATAPTAMPTYNTSLPPPNPCYQDPSQPGSFCFPPDDLIGTYMAPEQTAGTVIRRNMNTATQLPPPRMGRLIPSPSQLNFQDLTLLDPGYARPCTPPIATYTRNRTVTGTIPTAVLRE
jgi:hypothetical protein